MARGIIKSVHSVKETPIANITDNPKDDGWSRPLISKMLNGVEDFYVSVYRLGPHQTHPAHYHPEVPEIYFVLEGRGKAQVDEEFQWVEPGTVIYMPAKCVHSLRTEDEGLTVLAVF